MISIVSTAGDTYVPPTEFPLMNALFISVVLDYQGQKLSHQLPEPEPLPEPLPLPESEPLSDEEPLYEGTFFTLGQLWLET